MSLGNFHHYRGHRRRGALDRIPIMQPASRPFSVQRSRDQPPAQSVTSAGSHQASASRQPPPADGRVKCAACKHGGTRPTCQGRPFCHSCSSLYGPLDASADWISEGHFIWSEIRRYLHGTTSLLLKSNEFAFNQESLHDHICLYFNFEDRTPPEYPILPVVHPVPIISTLNQQITHDKHDRSRGQMVQHWSLDPVYLDQVVAAGIWGDKLWNNVTEDPLKPFDNGFWLQVQRFVGYLSMTHSLATTSLESASCLTGTFKQRVAVVYLHALFQRMDTLFQAILENCQRARERADPFDSTLAVSLVALSRGLEILAGLAHKMKDSNWKLWVYSDPHPLVNFQSMFNTLVEHIGKLTFSIECQLSSENDARNRYPRNPESLNFARKFPKKRNFPSHCTIKVCDLSQAQNGNVNQWYEPSVRQRFVDVLSFGTSGNPVAACTAPSRYITADNSFGWPATTVGDTVKYGYNFAPMTQMSTVVAPGHLDTSSNYHGPSEASGDFQDLAASTALDPDSFVSPSSSADDLIMEYL